MPIVLVFLASLLLAGCGGGFTVGVDDPAAEPGSYGEGCVGDRAECEEEQIESD